MNNCGYFDFSKNNPEERFDSFYKKGHLVIPQDPREENLLTKNHAKMVEWISAFKCLDAKGLAKNDPLIEKAVREIVDILNVTPNINYSPFSQFFMVYNATYSYFRELSPSDQFDFVYEMLLRYCKERHDLYLAYGYSDAILQVMSDNYSHKRNGKTSIEKILSILSPYGLRRISDIDETDGTNYYFLPDKGDRALFEAFIVKHGLKMESRAIEQNKLPDIVFACGEHVYICELKTMKGCGGGQNKQIVEVAYFIKFSEEDPRFHYVAFLDGDYANTLFHSRMPKVALQRNDILEALRINENNYFVNTAGFKQLVSDIFAAM